MNIILKTNEFKLSDLYFTDKKRNVIIDGSFTKIIYSTDCVCMGGIYFNLPCQTCNVNRKDQDLYLHYDPSEPGNAKVIEDLSKIEYQILDYYKKMHHLSVNISTILSRRLYSGTIKCTSSLVVKDVNAIDMVVKISGIWETVNEVGLAIKMVPVTSL